MFDYETMRLIWWALLGILLIGFAVMDGFDLGVAILLPFVARTDIERRIAINTVGPVWEGNQVWLILGGGAIFAAWPMLYAVAFSGFYLAMFLVLAALILRPVAFKFRSKLDRPRWRVAWDVAIFVSGLVPALIFGVEARQGVEDLAIDRIHRLLDALAQIARLVPVTLLDRLVGAGGGARGDRRAAQGAVLKDDVDLDGGGCPGCRGFRGR